MNLLAQLPGTSAVSVGPLRGCQLPAAPEWQAERSQDEPTMDLGLGASRVPSSSPASFRVSWTRPQTLVAGLTRRETVGG